MTESEQTASAKVDELLATDPGWKNAEPRKRWQDGPDLRVGHLACPECRGPRLLFTTSTFYHLRSCLTVDRPEVVSND